MRIPYQRAPEDPSWLLKAKAGRKLDALEAEEYFHYKFDRDFDEFVKLNNFFGVPTFQTVAQVIREYHYFKKDCLTSFLYCGIGYNK